MHNEIPDALTRRAVIVGPLFLDILFGPAKTLPKPGEEIWCDNCDFQPGGAANQARALTRIGIQTSLCSFLGEDLQGRIVEQMLEDEGIGTDLTKRSPKQSVTAVVSVGTDRAMISSGSQHAPPLSGPAPSLLIGDLRAIKANRETVAEWRRAGTLVVGDVGWDPSGLWDPQDLDPLDLVDVFVPNEDEALNYTRSQTATEAAEKLALLVPKVVVTRGEQGSVTVSDVLTVLPGFPVRTIDPTGAGDVFSAFLSWALLENQSLVQAASIATVAAGISTETLGSKGSPTIKEIGNRVGASEVRVPAAFDLGMLQV